MRQKPIALLVAAALLTLASPAFAQQADDWPMALRGPSTRLGTFVPEAPSAMTDTAATATDDWPMAARGPSKRVGTMPAAMRTSGPASSGPATLSRFPARQATVSAGSKPAAMAQARKSHGSRSRRHRRLHKH